MEKRLLSVLILQGGIMNERGRMHV